MALEWQRQQEQLAREERIYQEQLEQERQDRELAQRLAQESNEQLEESPPLVRKYDNKAYKAIVAVVASIFSP